MKKVCKEDLALYYGVDRKLYNASNDLFIERLKVLNNLPFLTRVKLLIADLKIIKFAKYASRNK